MCNCGKKRNQLSQQINNNTRQTNIIQQTQPPISIQKKEPVLFEYTGKTALSVIGSITRKNYRFNFPGHKQFVDAIDAAAMMAITVLKKCN